MVEKFNALDRKIHWLASYPKSGNTWVRMFLNAYASGFDPDINSAFQMVKGDHQVGVFQLTCARDIKTLTISEQFTYYPAVILNVLNTSTQKDIYVKTHNAKVNIDGTLLIQPRYSGKSVYIIRDPRDIVLSAAVHFNNTTDEYIQILADDSRLALMEHTQLVHILMSWSSHVKSWTISNKDIPVLVVKYEDLLENPEKYFKSILEYYEIPDLGEERFKFALEATQFEKLQAQEKKNGFKEKANGQLFFRSGKAGQWKYKLGKSQIKAIEKAHCEVMEKFGYELFCGHLIKECVS